MGEGTEGPQGVALALVASGGRGPFYGSHLESDPSGLRAKKITPEIVWGEKRCVPEPGALGADGWGRGAARCLSPPSMWAQAAATLSSVTGRQRF